MGVAANLLFPGGDTPVTDCHAYACGGCGCGCSVAGLCNQKEVIIIVCWCTVGCLRQQLCCLE